MKNRFINIDKGRNTHPRYILALIVTVLIFAIVIGGMVYYGTILFGIELYDPTLLNDDLFITNPIVSLYVDLFATIFIVFGCWFSVRFILKRRFISLITPNQKINWKRIFFGFSVFFIVLFIIQLFLMLFSFNDYIFNISDWNSYILLIIASLILVPIQTTSEELLFRGLLLQWLAKFTKNPILLALIVGAIFGSLHFANPEMTYGWIIAFAYLFSGFVLTYVTVKTNSSELAIGAHAANNIFVCLFITTESNAMGSIPSMFLVTNVNPYLMVFSDIVIYAIFGYIVLKKCNNKTVIMNQFKVK